MNDKLEIKKRLDNARELIQNEDFLKGNGLSNEVNIRIFCYAPEEEMIVQQWISQLNGDINLKCNIKEYNLYAIFLELCEGMDILEAIPEMEKEDGRDFLLEQLHCAVGEGEFIEKMKGLEQEDDQVMLITGVGDAFPFMRVHSLLEAMQPHFPDKPILVLYPGEFNGYALKLFNRLESNDYYRAFNAL